MQKAFIHGVNHYPPGSPPDRSNTLEAHFQGNYAQSASDEGRYILSQPPADRVAAVEAFSHRNYAQSASDEGRYILSQPPADRVAAVEAFSHRNYAQSASDEGRYILSQPPADRVAAVEAFSHRNYAQSASDEGRYILSQPPADRVAAVEAFSHRDYAQSASDEGRYILSQPPADRVAAVEAFSHRNYAQSASDEGRYILSQPPADRVAAVEAFSHRNYAQSASDEGRYILSQPPADRVAAVEAFSHRNYAQSAPEQGLSSTDGEVTNQLELTNQEKYQIIRKAAEPHSGTELYAAVKNGRMEDGLVFGFVPFKQASGHLGLLLKAMHKRAPVEFSKIFGKSSADLLAITNAQTPEGRLAPVEGNALTSNLWINRFKASAKLEPFRNAQNEVAIEHLFSPILPRAQALGLLTDRALAMIFEVALTLGVEEGVRWVEQTLGQSNSTNIASKLDTLVASASGDLSSRLKRLQALPALDDIAYRL